MKQKCTKEYTAEDIEKAQKVLVNSLVSDMNSIVLPSLIKYLMECDDDAMMTSFLKVNYIKEDERTERLQYNICKISELSINDKIVYETE